MELTIYKGEDYTFTAEFSDESGAVNIENDEFQFVVKDSVGGNVVIAADKCNYTRNGNVLQVEVPRAVTGAVTIETGIGRLTWISGGKHRVVFQSTVHFKAF